MSADRETEFTHEGVEYVAVDPFQDETCIGCIAEESDKLCVSLPECRKWVRNDGENKIWVVK